VGLSKQQIAQLPAGIEGIPHIDNQHELARLYGSATVFVNPTHAEALGITNIEALACGTPVVTYNVGGAAETIDATSGIAVPTGDVAALAKAIEHVLLHPQIYTAQACRQRSGLYDMGAQYKKYLNLYTNLLP
jgi:glycosyltransferase involved in cell wall biosynthesis